MHDFNLIRPASVEEAGRAFAQAEDGQFMAGGQTIIPVLKQRLAMPSDLIDLAEIDALRGITINKDRVLIGAMSSHAEVAKSRELREVIPALSELAEGIGDPHVRNRGTIGGSIANNDPAADYPAGLVGLGAIIKTDRRDINADDFFKDFFETALEEDELVIAVDFPVPDRAAYVKFPNPASRYAIVGVFVSKTRDSVRLAVTGAGPSVFRVPEMEVALATDFNSDVLDGMSTDCDNFNNDIHASAEYRAHLIAVMAKRAVAKANLGA